MDAVAELVKMAYQGNTYVLDPMARSTMGRQQIRVTSEPASISTVAAVFGVTQRRGELLSQAEFAWRRFGAGQRPRGDDLFTSRELAAFDPAESLWLEIDAQVAVSGSAFCVLGGDGRVRVLLSRWCSIVMGSQTDADRPEAAWDAEPVGLIYRHPDGRPEVWSWGEVGHVRPRPDPDAPWRGIAYLRPVLGDAARLDSSATYITRFFQNSATPNLIMKFPDTTSSEDIELFAELFNRGHQGASKAFRTAFIGGGADPMVVGTSLKDLDLAGVNAAAVSALCQASGVPLPLLGIQEGLEGALTYANGRQYARQFADFTCRSFWALTCRALGRLVKPPVGSPAELWTDVSRVSALLPEMLDDAGALAQQAQAIRTLGDGGWEPGSVVDAVTAGDLSRLVHSGLVPVQLQPPGAAMPDGGG